MLLQKLAQRDAHRLLDVARLIHVTGDAIELGAGVVLAAERGEPRRAAPHDVGRLRNGLDIVHRGRATVEADIRRKRRLEPRLALLALKAFEQRRLLAPDVSARAGMPVHVAVVALAPIAAPASRQPSTRRCGSCRMISRSLQVPGSDSSALITR